MDPERTAGASPRRLDLDWLRIGAFGLLILFHVAMFYVPWEWEVKSPRPVPLLLLLVEWSAPWRLLLLFLIGGAALGFALHRSPPRSLLARRSLHLLAPLLFAVLVVVPPQAYFRAIEQFDYHGGYLAFWRRYLSFDERFCKPGDCMFLPNWNHMWFIAYLWLYTAILAGLLMVRPALLASLKAQAGPRLDGWRLLVVPAVFLSLVRIALAHFFPETHRLFDDWYLHAVFVSGFVFGFLFLAEPRIMRQAVALRWLALAIGVVCYVTRTAYTWHYHQGQPIPFELKLVMAFVYGFDQWTWVVAALGFAHRHLATRDGKWRRYLTEAVFPFYILHQTAIVIFAHELARLRLPLALEGAAIVVLTGLSCAAGFELVRRVRWLRPVFGLKPLAAAPLPVSVPVSPAAIAGLGTPGPGSG
jgi:hypothetical protein